MKRKAKDQAVKEAKCVETGLFLANPNERELSSFGF